MIRGPTLEGHNPVGMLVHCQGREALVVIEAFPELCKSDSPKGARALRRLAVVLTGLGRTWPLIQGLSALAMSHRPYGTKETRPLPFAPSSYAIRYNQ